MTQPAKRTKTCGGPTCRRRPATGWRRSSSPTPAGRRRASPPTWVGTLTPLGPCSRTSCAAAPPPSGRAGPARLPTGSAISGWPRPWNACWRRIVPRALAQLSEALHADGIALGSRQVRRHLKRMKAGYRPTASSLAHKQDPAQVARAEAVLANLKAKAAAGELRLCYLDECGFAPSLPISYSWCLPGRRKRVPYEYPQGRRVNALATYEPYGSEAALEAEASERTLKSKDLLAYLERLPGAGVTRVVVLDNASLQVSKAVKARRSELARSGVYLYHLPAYSPELNEIEPLFKQVKHHEIPVRSYKSKEELREAVERGFAAHGESLRRKPNKQLRPAA